VGALLVTNYLIAFEVVSLLLMVAAVAGVVLGSGPRPRRVETGERKVEDQDEARRARSRALLDDALADESATRQVGE
jgi:hypothetical protein